MPKLVKKHSGMEDARKGQTGHPVNGVPMPHIVDTQGRLLDPRSAVNMPQLLADGQAAPDSIFHAPSDSRGSSQQLTINALLEQARRQGFGGANFIVNRQVRPGDQEDYNRKVRESKQYLPHRNKNYRTAEQSVSCPYCRAILENEEDVRGFDLGELNAVAKSGCETCDVLQQAITYFAKFVYLNYDMNRVLIKQRQNEPDRLLGQTKTVERVVALSEGGLRLVETEGQVAPYVTLSHCWGRPNWTRATRANLDSLKRDIPWTSLSKTFQDAIQVTEWLGFQYLWVDGLCIVQDDHQDWEYHVSMMAEIYSNSQITIAASKAENGQQGCFSRHSDKCVELGGPRPRQVRNPLLWRPYYLDGRDRDGQPKKFVAQLKTTHGLYNGVTPSEPLLRRAWVLQEQILSPRIIHFASGELYFECKHYVACECSGWNLRSNTSQWETRWRKAYEVFVQKPAWNGTTEEESLARSRKQFEAYRALIERFTELDITAELDRLPALSGVFSGRQDQYLAGMWREILLESLHWTALPHGSKYMARRPFQYRAPTWSWASIESPIWHVETDFYKTEHSPKTMAKIIEAKCDLAGQDARGQVSGGYLRIEGPTLDVEVVEIGLRTREMDNTAQNFMTERQLERMVAASLRKHQGYESCTYAVLSNGTMKDHCYLDVPLTLCSSLPAEVSVGMRVTCLVISSRTVLVLKSLREFPDTYTRVGIFCPGSDGWKFNITGRSIVIV
ncbi:hypothetical protein OEA41_009791 [Lepraria neglecta]|uniref:Heterokaryon incompatibility domain-containing protein n=1 Tax=Lepraria neglecta TaxID=209136 RepID=A0AAD9YV94_9LECA|nr:hypothetical protein OEA41_009791 [Lepraria neglecta]